MGYYANEELPALLKLWGLDIFHLVGNSFGGMISMSYATQDTSKRLASMVLSSSLPDIVLYYDAQWDETSGTLGRLPPFLQKRIRMLIESQQFESPEYQTIASNMYPLTVSRTWPPPSCLVDTINAANPEIATACFGASNDFMLDPSASMANYNVTSELNKIGVPVLLTEGYYDAVRPIVVDILEQNIPTTERLTLYNSGHFSMLDEPGEMNDVMADFFDRVETSIVAGAPFVTRPLQSKSPMVVERAHPATWFGFFITIAAAAIGLVLGRKWSTHAARLDYSHVA